jgi:hypothetical protein
MTRTEAVSASLWSVVFTVALAAAALINIAGAVWTTGLAGADLVFSNPTFQRWCVVVTGTAGLAVALQWSGRRRLAAFVAALQLLPVMAWLGWLAAHPVN